MKRFLLTASATALLAAGLSACGGNGGQAVITPTSPTPPPAAAFADQFGSADGFGSIFAKAPNTEPNDVAPGNVIPINPSAEPVNLPGT